MMRAFRCLLLSVGLPALAACGPGLDQGEGGLPSLALVDTRPVRGDTTAEIVTDVQMVFSESINPASVTDEAVKLYDGHDQRVAGKLEVADRVVGLRPAGLLRLSTRYQVRLGDGIRSIRENYLGTLEPWSFSTRQGVFAPSRWMGGMDRYGSGFQMEVGTDSGGTVWAVWLDRSANYGERVIVPNPPAIVISRYDSDASAWTVEHRFDGAPGNQLSFTPLRWDEDNNGYLAWTEQSQAGEELHLARHDARSQAWEDTLARAVPSPRHATHLRCVVDSNNNAQVLWLERSEGSSEINTVSYSRQRGRWTEASRLLASTAETQIGGILDLLRVGDKLALYYVSQTTDLVLLRSAEIQDGQLAAQTIVAELPSSFDSLNMTHDARGAAVVSWKDTRDPARPSLEVMQRQSSQHSWSSRHRLATAAAGQQLLEPHLAVDSAANALVSWISRGETTDDIHYAVFASATSQWAPPALFRSLPPRVSHGSSLLGDGRPVVFWSLEEGGGGSVWSSELPAPEAGWTSPQRLSQHPTGTISLPPGSPAVAATGQTVPFWIVENRLTREVDGVKLFFTHQDMWGAVFQ